MQLGGFDGGRDWVPSANAHALIPVDEERGGLGAKISLQAGTHAQQRLVGAFCRRDLRPQQLHRCLQVAALSHHPAQSRGKTDIFQFSYLDGGNWIDNRPVLCLIATLLEMRSVGPGLQPGVSHFYRLQLVLDRLVQQLQRLLDVEYLLLDLKHRVKFKKYRC